MKKLAKWLKIMYNSSVVTYVRYVHMVLTSDETGGCGSLKPVFPRSESDSRNRAAVMYAHYTYV